MNILFVCSMAKIRSRTAAMMCKTASNETKYCGTDADADILITQELVDWADKIILMERHHRGKVRRKFKGQSHKMEVWGIEDKYEFMEDSLCHIINRKKGKLVWGDLDYD
jgi:predicted protein tyrosine phosphatase